MSHWYISSKFTVQCMVRTVFRATRTDSWSFINFPSVSQPYAVLKVLFVQHIIKRFQRNCCQPYWCPLFTSLIWCLLSLEPACWCNKWNFCLKNSSLLFLKSVLFFETSPVSNKRKSKDWLVIRVVSGSVIIIELLPIWSGCWIDNSQPTISYFGSLVNNFQLLLSYFTLLRVNFQGNIRLIRAGFGYFGDCEITFDIPRSLWITYW